jgi:glycosyltransferase involved in cell wall biosynthesis
MLVSVIIPVYNAGRFLAAAIQSLLDQSFGDFEIIAVNDGSTDDSRTILDRAAAADSRIHVLNRVNTGIVGALNDGLAAARGELIARMDADDISLPGRFAEQVAYLAEHPECVAVGTDVLYTDPEGRPLIRHYPAEDHERIVAQLVAGNGGAMVHPSLMCRRATIEKVGGYRLRYQWIEDLDLYFRLAERGRLANIPEVHLHYRQHLKSVNSVRRDRNELRMELVNPRRLALGLAPLMCDPVATLHYRAPDFRRHWAYDAARAGNWVSARKNAKRAVIQNPFDRRNWRCLRYVVVSFSRGVVSARNSVQPSP